MQIYKGLNYYKIVTDEHKVRYLFIYMTMCLLFGHSVLLELVESGFLIGRNVWTSVCVGASIKWTNVAVLHHKGLQSYANILFTSWTAVPGT